MAFVAEGKYWVNNHAHILKPLNDGFDYWAEQLSLADYTKVITGAAQPKLSRENLGGVKVVIPPEEEIDEIIRIIQKQTTTTWEALTQAKGTIEKLKEYKATLINSAVTGKIMVTRSLEETA